MTVKLKYHGHSCWQVSSEDVSILIDPYLSGNKQAITHPDEFDKLDAIIVTHGHGDHIGDSVAIAKQTGALIISNFEICNYLKAQGATTHALHIGGGRQFPFGHVKLTIAHHGSTGPTGESLGAPAGGVLTINNKRIYHAGDTGLFLDMQLICEMSGPLDVALLPIGDNFTMGIDDAVKATQFLSAALNIPMHYDTNPDIMADPNEFVSKVEATGRKAKTLSINNTIEI